VRAAGPIVDGVLSGDLIVSVRDPRLTGAGDSLQAWVDALAKGLRRRGADHRRRRRDRGTAAGASLAEDVGCCVRRVSARSTPENRMTVTVAPGARRGTGNAAVDADGQDRPLVNGPRRRPLRPRS
jgi:hypothetical protein